MSDTISTDISEEAYEAYVTKCAAMGIVPTPKEALEREGTGMVPEMATDSSRRVCEACGEPKPPEAFKGLRGGHRDRICKACRKRRREEKKRADTEAANYPDQVPFDRPASDDETPTRFVPLTVVKAYVIEAYRRGYDEGRRAGWPEIVDVSLDELLEGA